MPIIMHYNVYNAHCNANDFLNDYFSEKNMGKGEHFSEKIEDLTEKSGVIF